MTITCRDVNVLGKCLVVWSFELIECQIVDCATGLLCGLFLGRLRLLSAASQTRFPCSVLGFSPSWRDFGQVPLYFFFPLFSESTFGPLLSFFPLLVCVRSYSPAFSKFLLARLHIPSECTLRRNALPGGLLPRTDDRSSASRLQDDLASGAFLVTRPPCPSQFAREKVRPAPLREPPPAPLPPIFRV